MRKLTKKEETILENNPMIVGTEVRYKAGRDPKKEISNNEKKRTRAFTPTYVRNVLDSTQGDFLIDEKKTKEYTKNIQQKKNENFSEEEE